MATRKKNENDGQIMENSQENMEAASENGTLDADTSSEIASEVSTSDETAPKLPRADAASGIESLPDDSPALEKLNVLADRFRVPAWQQAALLRYTGWIDDRLVTEDEYRRELENLKNRRIGGGRR